MRIGIDARFYGTIGKGLGRYTSELIAALERVDTTNEYLIFLRRANWDQYEPRNPRFRKILAEFPWYTAREQLFFPLWLKRFEMDLMHFTHFNVPYLYRRPFVVTVHDLILLSHPTPRASTLGPLRYALKHRAYRTVIGRALRDAWAVITVSNHAKEEIRRAFPFTATKEIAVTYGACSERFRTPPTGGPAPIPRPYALYVGNAYPHKNLETLIAAFAEFRRTRPGYRLVLVGEKDYFYSRVEADARDAGRTDGVVFRGRASDGELAALYDNAAFYVFPSLCEGFGLPPLEAMCRGVPVTSSDAASMPEVLGDAALYFDAKDARAIAAAMGRMADEPELVRTLKEKGDRRARAFDWTDTARRTLEIYEHATSPRT